MEAIPRRSVLYTPGARSEVLAKAARSAADGLIFDLEDAVAPDVKAQARTTVAEFAASRAWGAREAVVRVNGLDTPWCDDDVAAIAPLGVAAVLFPKINCAPDVARAQALLERHGASPATHLWCMIETPLAILNAHEIARAAIGPAARMTAWVMGTNDLVKELRAAHTRERAPLVFALSQAVLAARAYGLAILDGVHNDIRDADGLEHACVQAVQLGFDGKTVIHPSQIETCNRVFAPSESDIAQARAILAAFDQPEHRDRGVLQVDGRMVERLHADIARRTLAIADAIAARIQPD
jgi:citrate lyase subunit beta/citryl-CoA lyase